MTSGEVSRKGLSLVASSPMLIVAELAWRWAFAAGAIGVLLRYSRILRDALSLSAADQGMLLSGDLLQMLDAGSRIAAGAMPYLIEAAVGALPKIALIWLICITIGRSPLIRKVVQFTAGKPADANPRFWTSMLAVHAVRLLLLLIVVSAYLGAGRVAAFALGTDMNNPRVFAAMAAYIFTFSVGIAIYLFANFVAALAPLYVAQGRGTLDALADAAHASIREKSLLGGSSAANATLRTVVATVVTGASVLLLPMSRYLPQVVIVALAGLLTVVYCAASDILLLARTVSYALIVLGDPDEPGVSGQGIIETPLYSAPPDLRS
jgi:hypothetical protein